MAENDLYEILKREFPKFPKREDGWGNNEILDELKKRGFEFPLVSIIDVANEMRRLYGRGALRTW